jgi:hypothetical protein
MPGRWLSVAVAGLTIAVSAGARAADTREALEILVDLYGETGHPNYIYNQARCFERNGKYDQAVLSYEDYLRKATNLGDAERAQVEKSIADLHAKLASGPEAGGTAAPALLTPSLDVAAPTTAPKQPDVVLIPPTSQDRPSGGELRWQRKAGIAALVAAGGGLAIGVAGSILRQTRGSDFNDACTYYGNQPVPIVATSGADCRGKYDSIQGANRMMWIGYISGGVLAAAGTTLLVLTRQPHQTGGLASRCAPALGGATSGAVCEWRF